MLTIGANVFLFILFCIDLAGSLAGAYTLRFRTIQRHFLNLTGGFMLGIAVFWIWPDLAASAGTQASCWIVAVSFLALYAIDRYLFPICPCCSNEHRGICHNSGKALTPVAVFVHNLIDGFMASFAEDVGGHSGSGILAGLLAHKIPEAALFGIMIRSVSRSSRQALVSITITATAVVLGGLSNQLIPNLNAIHLLTVLQAFAAGSFILLGVHGLAKQLRTEGSGPALLNAAFGAVCTIVLERGSALVAN